MGIELHSRDMELLYTIKELFGFGNIRAVNKKMRFTIRKKEHLKQVIQIFDEYSMLTNKNKKYLQFKHLLLSNCIYYKQAGTIVESETFQELLSCELKQWDAKRVDLQNKRWPHYFSAWLVGFIEGEACFSIYNARTLKNYEAYPIASFDIGQKDDQLVITAIDAFFRIKNNN